MGGPSGNSWVWSDGSEYDYVGTEGVMDGTHIPVLAILSTMYAKCKQCIN